MLYLLFASMVWSFSFGLIKGNLTNLDPMFVSFMRMIIALPLFLPFFKLKTINNSFAVKLMLIGAIQYGLMYILCISAYQTLYAYQVVLFASCTPIYVIILDNILEKRFNVTNLVLALCACFGAGLIHFQSFTFSKIIVGFLLMQGADICFASGQVAYRRLMKQKTNLNDINIFALLFVGASILTGIIAISRGASYQFDIMSFKQLIIIVYLGAIASGIAFYWWNKGAKIVDVGTLAVFNNLKLPLGVFISLIVFKESANVPKLAVSLTIIISALAFAKWYAGKDKDKAKPQPKSLKSSFV